MRNEWNADCSGKESVDTALCSHYSAEADIDADTTHRTGIAKSFEDRKRAGRIGHHLLRAVTICDIFTAVATVFRPLIWTSIWNIFTGV